MSELSERQKTLLKGYGAWRPRVNRGAHWATTAGMLTGLTGKRKLMIPAAAAAGVAGVGDKMLEEQSEKNKKVRQLVGEGFDKKGSADHSDGVRGAASEGGRGLLSVLFSQKARLSDQAEKQLRELFPGAGKDAYGRTILLRRGVGK